ncbi:MAG: hypothetical protein ABIT09_12315 [Croceibacterium sp.]
MSTTIVILIAAFVIAAATALVRGLTAFFRDAELLRQNNPGAHEAFGMKQNRMMTQRVLFQAIAILLVVLLGSFASSK